MHQFHDTSPLQMQWQKPHNHLHCPAGLVEVIWWSISAACLLLAAAATAAIIIPIRVCVGVYHVVLSKKSSETKSPVRQKVRIQCVWVSVRLWGLHRLGPHGWEGSTEAGTTEAWDYRGRQDLKRQGLQRCWEHLRTMENSLRSQP